MNVIAQATKSLEIIKNTSTKDLVKSREIMRSIELLKDDFLVRQVSIVAVE